MLPQGLDGVFRGQPSAASSGLDSLRFVSVEGHDANRRTASKDRWTSTPPRSSSLAPTPATPTLPLQRESLQPVQRRRRPSRIPPALHLAHPSSGSEGFGDPPGHFLDSLDDLSVQIHLEWISIIVTHGDLGVGSGLIIRIDQEDLTE